MKQVLSLGIAFILLSGCENQFFEEQPETDPVTTFDYLWHEVDENYSYFAEKQVDWNTVYALYRPLVNDQTSENQLFQIMGSMLNQLRDGHVNLISFFDVSVYDISNLGPDQFEWRTIKDHYLPENYYISGPFAHEYLLGTNIGYVRFESFTGLVDNDNLDFVLSGYLNAKGLIIDLRENGGGRPTDMFALLSRFTSTERPIYKSRIKNGTGHQSFTSPKTVVLSPGSGIIYTKPVVFLTDRQTYSAGSYTALAAKALPNITLVGDTTGGGLGLPNGGQLPNGWTYRMSVTQALTLSGDPSYENGVPPDVQVNFDFGDLSKDEVLEAAIALLQ